MRHRKLGTTFNIYRLRQKKVCNFDDGQARTIDLSMLNAGIGHVFRISSSGRKCPSVYGNVIRYWFTGDVIIDEDSQIHWSYHDICPFIFDDSLWICSICSFFLQRLRINLLRVLESSFVFSVVCVTLKSNVPSAFRLLREMSDIGKRPSLKISDSLCHDNVIIYWLYRGNDMVYHTVMVFDTSKKINHFFSQISYRYLKWSRCPFTVEYI